MTYKTVVDERLSKVASEINGAPIIRRSGQKYVCPDCGYSRWSKHHPKKCPKCGEQMTHAERPGDDKKLIRRSPIGRCSSCAHCTVPPTSKWGTGIGVCHVTGKIVSLNGGCPSHGIGKALPMSFGRRPSGYKGLVMAVNDDHVWDSVREKDAKLRALINPTKGEPTKTSPKKGTKKDKKAIKPKTLDERLDALLADLDEGGEA